MKGSQSGWIKLHRKLAESDLWVGEKFTRGQAWVDLILLANHKRGFVRKHGVRIDLERGDVGWSKLQLAKRWGWSRGKVDRFILELKRDNRIDIKWDNKISTVISIKNYDFYQSIEQQTGQQIEQQTGNKRDTNKNEKNEKNNNNKKKERKIKERKKKKYSSLKDLTDEDFEKIASQYNVWASDVKDTYEDLVLYCQSRGKRYKNYYATLQTWIRRRLKSKELSERPQISEEEEEIIKVITNKGG